MPMNQQVALLNKILQQLDKQQQILEKLEKRLSNLETHLSIASEEINIDSVNYEYSDLVPIQKAEDFDTLEKRKGWWDSLEEQWQKAFVANSLKKTANYKPTDEELNVYMPADEDLQFILESPTLIVVGAKGPNAKINFELTNLSGVKHLTNLTTLIVTHHQITSLAGIEHLNQLETLFVNANQLSNLKEVYYLSNLTQLYCNANQITDLLPLANVTKLTTLNCSYNQLSSFKGISEQHTENLKEFFSLPNASIFQTEIQRMEAMKIKCLKG